MKLRATTRLPVAVMTAGIWLGIALAAAAQSNPIQVENAKPGSTDWLLTRVARHDDEVYELGWRRRRGIEAYASRTSVNGQKSIESAKARAAGVSENGRTSRVRHVMTAP